MAIILNAKGTSQAEFRIGKKGPLLKNNSGTFEFRNSLDTDFAEIKAAGTNPSSNNTLVTKEYVDSVATGLDVKESCRVATTSSADLSGYTYVPGNESTGNVWTGVSSAPTIDGVTLSDGDRLLIKNASDARGNGLFTYSSSNSSFIRTADADNSPSNEVNGGMFCLITEGDANSAKGYTLTSPAGIAVLGTDNLVFTAFSSAGSGLLELSDDLTPQLGGDLDVNSFKIISASNGDIELEPNGTGSIVLTGTTQLGGDLDVTGHTIITTSSANLNLIPSGTGLIVATSGYDMSSGPDYALATKDYVDSSVVSPAGSNTQIQFNDNGLFGGDTGFTTDGAGNIDISGSLDVDNINLDGNTISSTNPAGEIIIDTGGVGTSIIEAGGDETNVDLQLVAKGTGLVISESGYDMSSGPNEAFATKGYVDSSLSTPGGSNTQLQFNDNGSFGGDTGFTTDGNGNIDITGSLDVDDLNLDGNTISSTSTDTDIVLDPNGTGLVKAPSGYDMSSGVDSAFATKGYVDSTIGGDPENLVGSANSTTIVDGIEVSNAVNYIEIWNAETNESPKIIADGTDSDIGLEITTKGSGEILFTSGTNLDAVLDAGDAASSSDNDGGDFFIRAGDGDGTGNGGNISLIPGAGGASGENGLVLIGPTLTNEVDAIISAEDASLSNTNGGTLTFKAGAGDGTGDGGDIVFEPGLGGATGAEGSIIFSSSDNLNASLDAGDATASNDSGGNFTIRAGAGDGTGNGGDITLTPGTGGLSGGVAGSINLNGGVKNSVRTVSAATDTTRSDYIIFCDTATASTGFTVTLQTEDTLVGRTLIIKDSSGAANTKNVTIATEGSELIDGTATKVLNVAYGSYTLVSNGANWFIV